MPSLKAYQKNFKPYRVPAALVALHEFDAKHGPRYSAGFMLAVDDKEGLKSWSDEKAFLDALCPVGQATSSGAFYALWVANGADVDTAPVVVFGDDGGVHVLADGIATLLRILTLDVEPMIDHDGVDYYKDEDEHVPSDNHEAYVTWLAKTFKLKPVKDADDALKLVKAANKAQGKAFKAWMKAF